MASPEVQQFLETLRKGNPEAVEALLRQIDPFLRRVIRQRLIDGRLRRILDTTDVYHSIVRDFLARPASSSADPERQIVGAATQSKAPAALGAYLAAAVHHKIQTRARKEKRNAGSLPQEWSGDLAGISPSQQIAEQDFQECIRARLSDDKRQLFDLKMQGFGWSEIAERIGDRPDALRMRLTRAVAAILSDMRDA
jgi:hypothetical protein